MHLEANQIDNIKAAILRQSWAGLDETIFKRGDGHNVYVWIAYTPVATFVWFAYTREGSVLYEFFEWMRHVPSVVDGYTAYPGFLKFLQRCWRHLLSIVEELAVKNGGADEERYDMLLEFYLEIKKTGSLAPLTCMELSRRAYRLAILFTDDSVRGHLLNAIPYMFTFLAFAGMPPHNNMTESEIRNGIIPQRNSRHKTMTAEGRRTLSVLLTFTLSCRKQDTSAGRALVESISTPGWDVNGIASPVALYLTT